MNILILNTSFDIVSVIDSFTAFIWTTRYKDVGEFELHLPPQLADLKNLQKNYYVVIKESNRTMIIENKQQTYAVDEEDTLKISGRSLESILDRRIVWKRTTISGNLQNGIKKLLDENAINPTDPNRKIPGLIFKESTDEAITSLKIDSVEFLGEDLLSVMTALCEAYNIGFQILLYEDGTMEFSLYAGKDRSYEQEENIPVIFSPGYDNLFGSSYYESNAEHKNVILAMGSRYVTSTTTDENGEEHYQSKEVETFVEVSKQTGVKGLDRREMYGEVSGIVGDDEMSEETFKAQIAERGAEELAEHPVKVAFEGEIEAERQFVYGRDFFIGDVVQVVDKYGMEARSRVEEVILSEDATGRSIYPTFVGIED